MTAKMYKLMDSDRQLGEYAVNLYPGCGYGCLYCNAPRVRRYRYWSFSERKQHMGVTYKIRQQAPKYKGCEVLLSLRCDPYQPNDIEIGTTREVIKILLANEIKIRVLTKGGKNSERDFDLLSARPGNTYGASLTFVDDNVSKQWEPGTALPGERLSALEKASRLGIRTWALLEPVIDPEQTLELIRRSHEFVDSFVIRQGNYNIKTKVLDWSAFVHEAKALCKGYGKDYFIEVDHYEEAS